MAGKPKPRPAKPLKAPPKTAPPRTARKAARAAGTRRTVAARPPGERTPDPDDAPPVTVRGSRGRTTSAPPPSTAAIPARLRYASGFRHPLYHDVRAPSMLPSLTPQLIEGICDVLSVCPFIRSAGAAFGVTYPQLSSWRHKGKMVVFRMVEDPAFVPSAGDELHLRLWVCTQAAIGQAEAADMALLNAIAAGEVDGDWKALAWKWTQASAARVGVGGTRTVSPRQVEAQIGDDADGTRRVTIYLPDNRRDAPRSVRVIGQVAGEPPPPARGPGEVPGPAANSRPPSADAGPVDVGRWVRLALAATLATEPPPVADNEGGRPEPAASGRG